MMRRKFLQVSLIALACSFLPVSKVQAEEPAKILIKANGKIVGKAELLDVSTIYSSPYFGNRNVLEVTGNLTRVRFDQSRIQEAFTSMKLHSCAQRLPLQIEVHEQDQMTTIQNVWLVGKIIYDTTSDFIIADSISFVAISVKKEKI